MGQQQLLILILVMIIVGLAIMLAITLFQNEEVELLEEEFTEVMLETATNIQVFWHKPRVLGGGNHSFSGLSFNKIPCLLGKKGPGSIPASCTDDEGTATINLFSGSDSVFMYCDLVIAGESYEAEYVVLPDRVYPKKKWEKQ